MTTRHPGPVGIARQDAPPNAGVGGRAIPQAWLFAAALFASAALLFVVQPMFGKAMLPHVGAAPGTWGICAAFYQTALLAGYAYAFVIGRSRLSGRAQILIHGGVLLLGGAALPPSVGLPPVTATVYGHTPPATSVLSAAGTPPALWLAAELVGSLGLPFFALSATAPLLQAWYGRLRDAEGREAESRAAATNDAVARDPYRLYAASSLGSFTGLVAYPALLEPALGLRAQSFAWAVAYMA